MRFDILTIFPQPLTPYFKESILGRAQKEDKIKVNFHDLRQWSLDKHKTVDDTPYGGGAGMVMKVEPIFRAVEDLRLKKVASKSQNKGQAVRRPRVRVVLLSASGAGFTQAKARSLARLDQLILIAGRYEGVDQRVAAHVADEEISIGPYVLTGGELPAAVIVDSVARLLPGVLKNEESLEEESHDTVDLTEYPQYTKPEEFNGWKVPPVLLSGHHGKIQKWRQNRRQKYKRCCGQR